MQFDGPFHSGATRDAAVYKDLAPSCSNKSALAIYPDTPKNNNHPLTFASAHGVSELTAPCTPSRASLTANCAASSLLY